MTLDNEQIVRQAYKIAEDRELEGWVAAFTDDGMFTDESIGITFRGPDELPKQVVSYATAFPDMHASSTRSTSAPTSWWSGWPCRETHLGPRHLPDGTPPATGKRMDPRAAGSCAAPATRKYQVKGLIAGNGRRAFHHPVPAHTPGS